jgi:uncharacterized membrane protein YeaQ/YmgE (transglycosylase-associated protein family)
MRMARRTWGPARLRYAAIAAGLFLWGVGGAPLDDVVLVHDLASVMTPWLALFLMGALIRQPSPAGVFISTAIGSVGAVVGYYAWKDLAGQGLYVPGLQLWTAAALIASALAATLTAVARRRPSATAAFLLAGGGFALGEAVSLVAGGRSAPTLVAAGADVAVALLLLWLAARARAPDAARPWPSARKLRRVGWLGSGAAFFWIVLLSVRAVV